MQLAQRALSPELFLAAPDVGRHRVPAGAAHVRDGLEECGAYLVVLYDGPGVDVDVLASVARLEPRQRRDAGHAALCVGVVVGLEHLHERGLCDRVAAAVLDLDVVVVLVELLAGQPERGVQRVGRVLLLRAELDGEARVHDLPCREQRLQVVADGGALLEGGAEPGVVARHAALPEVVGLPDRPAKDRVAGVVDCERVERARVPCARPLGEELGDCRRVLGAEVEHVDVPSVGRAGALLQDGDGYPALVERASVCVFFPRDRIGASALEALADHVRYRAGGKPCEAAGCLFRIHGITSFLLRRAGRTARRRNIAAACGRGCGFVCN